MRLNLLCTFFLLIIFGIFSCKTPKDLNNNNNDYELQWQKIDKLIEEQMVKQAESEIFKLIKQAQNNNEPLIATRGILTLMKLNSLDQEEFMKEKIPLLKGYIKDGGESTSSSLLNYSLALIYYNFWESNYGQIPSRIEGSENLNLSYKEWSSEMFIDTIDYHFNKALNFPSSQTVPISAIKEFFTNYESQEELMLWDFLMLENIRLKKTYQYSNYYNDVDDCVICKIVGQEFKNDSIIINEESGISLRILKLYQNLINKLDQNAQNKLSILQEIEKIKYYRSNDVQDLNDDLSKYREIQKNSPFHYISDYAYASSLIEKSQQPELEKKVRSLLKIEASEIFLQIINNNADKIFVGNSKAQLAALNQPTISAEMEMVYTPNKSILLSINYNNLNKIYYRIYKLNKADYFEDVIYKENPFDKKEMISESSLDLPSAIHKHIEQKIEIPLDGLESGYYGIVISNAENFSTSKEVAIFNNAFLVSNLYIHEFFDSEKNAFVLECIDRTTGKSVTGAKFSVYERTFNQNKRKAEFLLINQGTGNPQYESQTSQNNEIYPFVEYQGQFFFNRNGLYYNYYQDKGTITCHIFTDRSIYRPGQDVYFKGIMVRYDEERMPALVQNKIISVEFYDPFGQLIGTQNLNVDALGAFDSKFTIPPKTQNGYLRFEIKSEGLNINVYNNIKVEEYKRPKFKVEFLDVEQAFQLNSDVSVIANAQTFTGLPISNAKVQYKVYRSEWVPYFYYRYKSIFPPMNGITALIASGSGTTNEKGQIEINFKAVEDQKNIYNNKSYNFSVELDITDSTGETKTAKKEISISDKSVFIKLNPIQGEDSKFLLQAVNSEDKAIKVTANVKIYAPKDMGYRNKRYWEMPDIFQGGIAEMSKKFPEFLMIPEEENFSILTYESQINIQDSTLLDIAKIAGYGSFKILIEHPNAIPIKTIVQANNFDTSIFGTEDLIHFNINKPKFKPGETAVISIGSSVKELEIHVMKLRDNKVLESKWYNVSGVLKLNKMISESDRGGYSLMFRCYYKNRSYTYTKDINVPWSQKTLSIIPQSIRYITEPGAKEKWEFLISDENGNPVESSNFASMYDASLDEFIPHSWQFNPFPSYFGNYYTSNFSFGSSQFNTANYYWNQVKYSFVPEYLLPYYNYAPNVFYGRYEMMLATGNVMRTKASPGEDQDIMDGVQMESASMDNIPPSPPPPPHVGPDQQNIRTNLNETAFFYPNLNSNMDGELGIEYTMNDAISEWKFQNFAYTADLKFGSFSTEIISRKELMIQANQVRFLRKGDKISLAAKLINISDRDQLVDAQLNIFDEKTGLKISDLALYPEKKIVILKSLEQKEVFWEIIVPGSHDNLKLVYSVAGEKHKDAEQYIIPIMPNDIFLIESVPLQLHKNETKDYKVSDWFDRTKRSSAIVIESTGSPAWYAIKSLPYLTEQTFENSEALFNRYFSNSLAFKVIQDNPLIRDFYSEWRAKLNLKSSLTLNSELKNIDLNETPWLANALTEEEEMLKMSNLFNEENVTIEISDALNKLMAMQMPNGSLPWFAGGSESLYMSQYVLEGLLKMDELKIQLDDPKMDMFKSALYKFCQDRNLEIYKSYSNVDGGLIPDILIKHLAMYTKLGIGEMKSQDYIKMINVLKQELKDNWFKYDIREQIYITTIMWSEDKLIANKIAQSLFERSFYKEELGRFWNVNNSQIISSWSIENQALLIGLFHQIGRDQSEIEEMKYWLISNKRTNNWGSTIATSSAIYALSLGNTSALKSGKPVITKLDGKEIKDQNSITGLNYQKNTVPVNNSSSLIMKASFTNPNDNIAWVNIHHQFFQDYDKIKRTENAFFDLKKEVFKVNEKGELETVDEIALHLGNRIRVRLVIDVDREMEFIHLVDDRPSGAEPFDLISGYQWKNSVGYYKSIKDLGTHFFIDHLYKGRYIVEYDMYINNLGEFNSGIAKIQNLYAPEFNDYSKNTILKVN